MSDINSPITPTEPVEPTELELVDSLIDTLCAEGKHDLVGQLHRLRAMIKGPDGYQSWNHAAVSERMAKVDMRNQLQEMCELLVIAICGMTAERMQSFSNEVLSSGGIGNLSECVSFLRRLRAAGVPGDKDYFEKMVSELAPKQI